MNAVTVVGAGLAGSEAAYQLAIRGIPVRLIEMKPKKMTPAHVSPYFAELVCSNSLRSDELTNAVGLLKEELRRLGSIVMRCADEHRVAAGGALAVDREGFARAVTEAVRALPNVEIVEEEAVDIPDGEVIIASGPAHLGRARREHPSLHRQRRAALLRCRRADRIAGFRRYGKRVPRLPV